MSTESKTVDLKVILRQCATRKCNKREDDSDQ